MAKRNFVKSLFVAMALCFAIAIVPFFGGMKTVSADADSVTIAGTTVDMSSFETLAYPYPGKSAIMNLSEKLKKFINRVLPGVFEVLAIFLLLANALIKDDLPTFERPKSGNSGYIKSGHCDNFSALIIKFACNCFPQWPCSLRRTDSCLLRVRSRIR